MNMTNNQAIGKTKNTASITNRLHKLIHITALLGITMFGSINTYATSLKDLFDSTSNLDFSGSINVNGSNQTANINSEDFLIDSNTTYIDTNTLPIQNSIGGGGSKRKYRWL